MARLHRPAHAIVGRSHETNDNQEQQANTIAFWRRELNSPRLSQWIPEIHISAQITKPLMILMPEMRTPRISDSLPFFTIASTSQPPSREDIALNAVSQVQHHDDIWPEDMSESQTTGYQDDEVAIAHRPNSESTRSSSNSCKKQYRELDEEVINILDPIINVENPEHAIVLLCWGNKDHCQIFPVQISADLEDDVAVWQEIRREWQSHRSAWRKYLSFMWTSKVDIAEISIAARDPNDPLMKTFIGTYKPALNRKRTVLTMALSIPSIAAGNRLLDYRGGWKDRIILTHRHILDLVQMSITNGNGLCMMPFRGIVIEESLTIAYKRVIFLLITIALFLMVLGAKHIYSDWGVAWNVGSFLVALTTLSLMWTR